MSYRLEAGEALAPGVKRIAYGEIDSVLDPLREPIDDVDTAVHASRKALKKLRGLLRLLRQEIGEEVYQRENVCFRDAGRRLAELRRSAVMIKTLDSLANENELGIPEDTLASARETLVIFHNATRQQVVEEEEGLVEALHMVQAARQRVADWPVAHDSFTVVYGGLKKVYKRGRNRLADARDEPEANILHEWRKRAKYLWHGTRILWPIWPRPMKTLAKEIHKLCDDLGELHDLNELQQLLEKRPLIFNDTDARTALMDHIEARGKGLHAAVFPRGQRIYAESPKAFAKRLEAYWEVARE